MPASYELDPSHGLVRTRAWGVLTDDEMRQLYAGIRADPEFDASFQQLCDMREVTQVTATVDTLRQLARTQIFAPGARRAFVVGRDVDFGLARLFQAYSDYEGAGSSVFRDWGAAEEWLGLRVARDS